ncbi:MAG: hypothetical protein ABI461_15705, partial [Polyangiaceae bacterium]
MLRSSVVLAAIVASSLVAPPVFAAGEGNACTASYEKAQYLRRDKKLRAARKELLTCSQTSCPAAIVSDCTTWMSEVEKIIPSVVFDARDSKGQSVASVKVSMDGELLQNKLDGVAIQVDPGTHTFRFEPDQGAPGEQQVLVLEGEKARVITFAMASATNGGGAQTAPGPEQPKPEPRSGSGTKTIAYVVGGVGVAALATGIIFGALGSSQASADKDGSSKCAPNCSDDEVSSIKTKLIISDVLIPVGIVGIGAAVVLYLTSGSSKSTTTGW